ncbi:MAG: VWA domain-containing protein [Caldilineaceae bacterium]
MSEIEPNNQRSEATLIAPLTCAEGESVDTDQDYYRIKVDSEQAKQRWDVELTHSAGETFQFCILDAQGEMAQCRSGSNIVLSDLVFVPGEVDFLVKSRRTGGTYTLSFTATDIVGPSDEVEPNDLVATASPIVNSLSINGRFVGEEDDLYRFESSGSVARFRAEVEGTGVAYLALLDAAGNELTRRSDAVDSVLALDDLYLAPGVHFFQLHGADGTYQFRLIPLTEAWDEREPNDDILQATRLPFELPMLGRLPNAEDLDQYRFSLSNATHLLITVVPPTAGQISIDLRGYFLNGEPQDGQPFRYEAFLPAGDYTIQLKTRQPSPDPYTILIEHLNPFALPVDLEPANNNRTTAPSLPPSFIVDGVTGSSSDREDWYRLPTTQTATWVNVQVEGAAVNLTFFQGEEELHQIKLDRNKGIVNGPLPNAPLNEFALRVNGRGNYHLVFWFDNGPQALTSGPPPAQLAITLPSDRVAAFANQVQRLEGSLFIQNTTPIEQTLDLAVTSSDFAWQPELEQSQITLAPNESQSLPLHINMLPNVAEGDTTFYATSANLALDRSNTSTTLSSICGLAPTGMDSQWTSAGALTGGLNVAWLPLGGKPVEDRRGVADLLDGRVSFESGFQAKVGDGPVTIELAGKEPLPIQGVILNPTGQLQPPNTLRNFTVAVSTDGKVFEPVLSGTLSPVLKEQPFAFAQPVQAHFVRLSLLDSHKAELQSDIGLGEFKVIAAASALTLTEGFDLASPEMGGHVVLATPSILDAQKMLSGLSTETKLSLQETMAESAPTNGMTATQTSSDLEWVIGFQQNRAAQIRGIEWTNGTQGSAAQRIATLELYVSLDSPMGPWQPVKSWKLDPRSTGPQTLNFAAPLWARFVRFVVAPPSNVDTLYYPKALRILEQPSDQSYRSILAEWGEASRSAIYEQLQTVTQIEGQSLEDDALGENNQRQHAQALASGQSIHGTVSDSDVDWFALDVPIGSNHVQWQMDGNPVDVQLLDDASNPISYTVTAQGERRIFDAEVSSGHYNLRMASASRSVLIAWNTTRSLQAYVSSFQAGLARFAAPSGQQAVKLNLLPFGRPGALLLPEWSSDPAMLQQALTSYGRNDFSNDADVNLQIASKALLQQPGAHILILFSGQLNEPNEETTRLWNTLSELQPQIFAFALPSASDAATQTRLQDWASINQGGYATVATQDEFESALAQVACQLQSTAAYQLRVNVSRLEATPTPTPAPTLPPQPTATPTATPQPKATDVISDSSSPAEGTSVAVDQSSVPAEENTTIVTQDFPGTPGLLSVVGTSYEGAFTAPIRNGSVEIILDASGSMMQTLDDRYRIDIAREVLSQLVTTVLDPDTPLALRVFGHREPRSCRTDLEIPLAPLDQTNAAGVIAGVMPKNFGMTPIGASLAQVPNDMAQAQGAKVIVLVTDGEETCGGNPAAEIQKLVDSGQNIRINIVGFAVNDEATKKMFMEWAQLGKGFYFNATNALELSDAIDKALQVPFRVYTADGKLVTSGIVNGGKIEVPTGQYTVVVETEKEQRFEDVLVVGGQAVQLEVKGEE